MENDDGRVIDGLSRSEWKQYKERYTYLSEEEMFLIIGFSKSRFESCANYANAQNQTENKDGRPALLATPLFMLLSVHVKPTCKSSSSSFSVFGEITTVSSYLYKTQSHNAETFSGVYLTLKGPSSSCNRDKPCLVLGSRKLSITLYHQPGQHLLFHDDEIILDYSQDCFEHVKVKVIQNTEISLTLKYVAIPIAVYGCLGIRLSKREGCTNLSESVNVCGKVVAKYKNTFGNYGSEEIVLFDKNPELNRYESVRLDMANSLLLRSRCWVAAPAYSLLSLHIELFDSEKRLILIDDAELEIGFERLTPTVESAIEVFSVLVCYYEDCTPLQIHGRLQFNTFSVSSDFIENGFDIFKREKEDPLTLLRRGDALPLLNGGSRRLPNDLPVSVKCDLKDTLGGLSIKGFQTIRDNRWFDRQLCSIFRGGHGFAVLHFTIFRSVVQAHLDVFVYQRKRSQCAVFGSICARYKAFDYSSQYKRNWYSIVFFKKGREELVWMDSNGSIPLDREDLVQKIPDGLIPLSRSSFVVPSYSSCKFYLDLTIGTDKLTRKINVVPGTPTISIKGEECELEVVLEWSEVM